MQGRFIRSRRSLLLVAAVFIMSLLGYRHSLQPPSFFPWTTSSERNVSVYIPAEGPLLLTPRVRCSGDEFLVVVVPSSPGNIERREAIRNTYGQWVHQVHDATNSKSPLQQSDWTNASTDESFYVVWEDYADKPSLRVTMAESTNSHHLDEKSNVASVANSVAGEEGAAASTSAHHMRGRLVPHVQLLTSAKLNRTLKTKLLFVLGRESDGFPVSAALMNEQKAHGDLVVENFIDTYLNLTLKSLFVIKYVKTHCPNVKYVAKVDDDVFLHVPNLHRTLTTRNTTEKLIMGYIICNSPVTFDPGSKWYSPHYMYTEDYYPNYLSGTAYILSSSVLTPLLEAAMLTPLFHLEDVYITGILAQKIGVTPQDSVDFSYKTNPRDPCLYQNLSVGHDMEPLQMYELWNTLHLTNMTTSCGPVTAAHIGYISPRECSAPPEPRSLLSRLSSYFN